MHSYFDWFAIGKLSIENQWLLSCKRLRGLELVEYATGILMKFRIENKRERYGLFFEIIQKEKNN